MDAENAFLYIVQTDIVKAFLSISTGLIIAIVSAYVTVRLSIKRFREERWWERKAESYTSILVALHNMKKYLEESQENQIGNEAKSNERMNNVYEGWIQGEDELSKAVDIGIFLFSEQAIEQILMLQSKLKE